MRVQVTGCSHHSSNVALREQIAFSTNQVAEALRALRDQNPGSEAVLLSTCNRVELYIGSARGEDLPESDVIARFFARFHGLEPATVRDQLFHKVDAHAVRHLFTVASSLDSMVVGEAQILSQVKQAFAVARNEETVGPLFHQMFQAANRVAKRVATETAVHRRRVSIPSVAVTEYAKRLFETFADKSVLVIGAGDMAEETLHYLQDEGAQDIVIVNRTPERAQQLAARIDARVAPWDQLLALLPNADLIVSTTGAQQPIVTLDCFRSIERQRADRLQFILDLAVPRDFDPAIDQFANVFLYCIDDLKVVCDRNRKAREKEWPRAQRIIDEEANRFLAATKHRDSAPTIRRLRQQANEVKQLELQRLFHKLSDVDPHQRREIEQSVDRIVNKLLHPPMESLRAESETESGHDLLDALRQLFQIDD